VGHLEGIGRRECAGGRRGLGRRRTAGIWLGAGGVPERDRESVYGMLVLLYIIQYVYLYYSYY
jgi:hypothetical protein